MIQNPDRKILVMWMIAIGLISARELKSGQLLPRPHVYVGSAVVYGIAAILAEVAPDVAVLAAAGWTLAIAYSLLENKGAGLAAPATAAKGVKP